MSIVYNPGSGVVHQSECGMGPCRLGGHGSPYRHLYKPFPAEMVKHVTKDRLCTFCRPEKLAA
jgi:hypothetical protein